MGLDLSSGFAKNKGPDQPAQTGLHLCSLRFGKYNINLLRWNFNYLASLLSKGDWFESHFVGNPEGRFCRDEAPMITNTCI